jgi:two-component system sensor histidine kinase MtrB
MSARLGVRARVQLSFALGGLLVSAFLAAVSWNLTTTYLHNQREATATRSALVSADLLVRRLDGDTPPSVESLRQSVTVGNDAVFVGPGLDGGVAATPRVGPADLPRPLIALAAQGTPAQQRISLDGEPALAIALPAGNGQGVYVEVFSLSALDGALRVLAIVLAATAALATLLAAALGRWATQRTLRPLQTLVDAAAEVASGALDTRVDAGGDPDLEPLAEAFNTTTASLRSRVERDARFASDVSHELRSPVTTMLNAAELLQNRRAEFSAPACEALDLLHEELQRFRQLVDDLLEISRGDQEAEVSRELVVLAELVRQSANTAAGRPVTSVAAQAEHVLVDADPRRLDRVVTNLVRNAAVHGGGLCDVSVERVDEVLQVKVRDEGVGVDRADRELIFERFFRGRASRAGAAGSGLGLAIVAQQVRAHGGRVWIEDNVPRGSTFVVELPVSNGSP